MGRDGGSAFPWPALVAGTRAGAPRWPFYLQGVPVGSVAQGHLPQLCELTPVLQATGIELQVDAEAVRLRASVATTALCAEKADVADWADVATPALTALNNALRASGHIPGWRDEIFAVPDPTTLVSLATMERAAARFWGTLTFGAHATGFVRGADGRPSHLWIAQRSHSKATDPGLYDNLIGGGVPFDQTPQQALVREAFEEAGLTPTQVQAASGQGVHSVLRVHRDVPHGLQHEWLYCFDMALPAGVQPHNQDGEVAGFTCLPVAEAVALAASERMTVDASLVTLDFLLRHGLLERAQARALAPALTALRVTPPPLG